MLYPSFHIDSCVCVGGLAIAILIVLSLILVQGYGGCDRCWCALAL